MTNLVVAVLGGEQMENKGFEITCLNCGSRRALINYDELYDRYFFECTDCGNYGEEVDWFDEQSEYEKKGVE